MIEKCGGEGESEAGTGAGLEKKRMAIGPGVTLRGGDERESTRRRAMRIGSLRFLVSE
jgi:hypothetical protein